MYDSLVHIHSGFRWLVLIFLLGAIIVSARGLGGKVPFTQSMKRWGLAAMTAAHIQLITGLVLYFISPNVQYGPSMMKTTILRFYTVEHISLMLIAIILITVGYMRSKRASTDAGKSKAMFWTFLIGLVLILASIPWPFRDLGAGWY